jgi:hypothetical protein
MLNLKSKFILTVVLLICQISMQAQECNYSDYILKKPIFSIEQGINIINYSHIKNDVGYFAILNNNPNVFISVEKYSCEIMIQKSFMTITKFEYENKNNLIWLLNKQFVITSGVKTNSNITNLFNQKVKLLINDLNFKTLKYNLDDIGFDICTIELINHGEGIIFSNLTIKNL